MAYSKGTADAALKKFAAEHGLTFASAGGMPGTGFAMAQSESFTRSLAGGDLPGGITGLVADYGRKIAATEDKPAYEEHGLLLVTRVPESIGFIPQLLCFNAKQGGLAATMAKRLAGRTIQLESIRFNERYEVVVIRNQDENWLRQLFEPSFIDYLADQAPEGCYFELLQGVLYVRSAEAADDPGAIERVCQFASTVADRLRSESLEEEGSAVPSAISSPYTEERRQKWIEEPIGSVQWPSPPADVAVAAKAYRGVARRSPLTWIFTFGFALLFAAIIVGIPAFFLIPMADFFELGLPLGTVALAFAGIYALVALFMFAKLLRSSITTRATQLGFEAFMRGYAGQRGLTPMDSSKFHAEHMRLRLPGVVQTALVGDLPGAGAGAFVAFHDHTSERKQTVCGQGVALVVEPDLRLPLVWVLPRGSGVSDEDILPLGGFMLTKAEGVIAPVKMGDPTAALDPRLTKRFAVIADDGCDPATLGRVLSPSFVDWLLSSDHEPLGLMLEDENLVVLTPPTPLIDRTVDSVDKFCRDAGLVRDQVRATHSQAAA